METRGRNDFGMTEEGWDVLHNYTDMMIGYTSGMPPLTNDAVLAIGTLSVPAIYHALLLEGDNKWLAGEMQSHLATLLDRIDGMEMRGGIPALMCQALLEEFDKLLGGSHD